MVLAWMPWVAEPPAAIAADPQPAGFALSTIFGGYSSLDEPVAVKFSTDGRAFVAEHDGRVKVFDSIYDSTPTTVISITSQVHGFWDRGFLGLALHPDFPSTPLVYGLYAWDTGGWGSSCPDPPGATDDGCVVNGRLSRWTVSSDNVAGSETVMLEGYWCQQYPSHSVGDLVFGPDGALYVSAGDGASFNWADYGQGGGDAGSPTAANPCDDPPSGVAGTQNPPNAEGGALRSQDILTAGDPVSYDGAILRIDPITGFALPSNPLYDGAKAANSQPDEARIIAYGLRNPFRMAFQPGTDDLYIGDVGWNAYEELNKIADPDDAFVENFGWPCYEGGTSGSSLKQSGYDSQNLDMCEDLYDGTIGSGVTAPFWAYAHGGSPGTPSLCNDGGDSITGIAFATDTSYPTAYNGAVMVGDHSNRCVWVLQTDAGGTPDPSSVSVIIDNINVVDLEHGPGGEIYVVDFEGGEVLRLTHASGNAVPTASVSASPTTELIPLAVNFDGTASSDPEDDQLVYEWDLDDDGAYDDGTGAVVDHIFTSSGYHNVGLRVTDFHGSSGTASVTIEASAVNTNPPVLANISSMSVDEYQEAAFTAQASDPDIPTQDLTFSIQSGPGSIDPVNGQYSWTPSEPDDGEHDVVVRVTDNGTPTLFDQQTVTITVNEVNEKPAATITAPSSSLKWAVGDEIAVSGSGSDPDEGALPESALSWDVDIHHCETPTLCHTHNVASHVGSSWTFFAPDHEFDTWLTITLRVTDAAGATDTASVSIYPKTVTFSLRSQPAGLDVVFVSDAFETPFDREVLFGSEVQLGVSSSQVVADETYVFVSWDDDYTSTTRTETGTADATFTAHYSATPRPVDDAYTVDEGATLSTIADIDGVLHNDADAEDDTLVALIVDVPTNASSFSVSPDGSFTYVHDGSETTSDSFAYRATDGVSTSGFATVDITVTPVNDDPVIEPLSNRAGIVDSEITVDADATDVDVPNQTLTFSLAGGPGSIDPSSGLYRWTPADADIGRHVVTVRVVDGAGGSDETTFAITVGTSSDGFGLVDPSQGFWRLYDVDGTLGASFFFGNPLDTPFMGDWDCDGIDTPGMYRQSDGYVYLRNSNDQGVADIRFFFGNPGDVPIAGDFDGDGCDTVSVYRPSQGHIFIINELGENDGGLGEADSDYYFGNLGDTPFTGDFDRDGIDTVGLHRTSTGLVYFRNTLTTGSADISYVFGNPDDQIVAGDWGVLDGQDTPAAYRPTNTVVYFRSTNTEGIAEFEVTSGRATDIIVSGGWTS